MTSSQAANDADHGIRHSTTGGTGLARMEWVARDHPERASLEAFIGSVYCKMYGAQVSHFCDTLVGCRDVEGAWVAALGFSLAGNGNTFLEHYLDAPLENMVASSVGAPVSRQQIVEVGNLAATRAGAARELIVHMTRQLHEQGLSWVAFTATRCLLNSFARLRIGVVALAQADPHRLPGAGKNWGSYYATKPQVMFGDIRSGYGRLAA